VLDASEGGLDDAKEANFVLEGQGKTSPRGDIDLAWLLDCVQLLLAKKVAKSNSLPI
jgi:hypothetical protein